MAHAIRNVERTGRVDTHSALLDRSLVRGVVTGLLLVAPFWIALALAVLRQFH